jgi:hypothetical protein
MVKTWQTPVSGFEKHVKKVFVHEFGCLKLIKEVIVSYTASLRTGVGVSWHFNDPVNVLKSISNLGLFVAAARV